MPWLRSKFRKSFGGFSAHPRKRDSCSRERGVARDKSLLPQRRWPPRGAPRCGGAIPLIHPCVCRSVPIGRSFVLLAVSEFAREPAVDHLDRQGTDDDGENDPQNAYLCAGQHPCTSEGSSENAEHHGHR